MTVSRASRSEQLSFWTKAAYAIGDLGNSAGPGTVIPFWYLYFLTDVAKLDPALAGLAFSIGKLWDAVNDPLVGMLSDRTRTRWGRRRPYLLFGAVPFGLTFALLWIVPPIQNQILLCLYFAFMYMLFDTAFTLVGCPYDALTPELTLDHDERTSLTTYRMFVSIVAGLLSALVFALFVFPAFSDPQTAFLVIGLLCGVVFIPPVLITFFGTRERVEFQAAETMRFAESLRFLLRNREWRYTVAINLLSWLPVDIATAVFAYFLVYWTGMSKDEASLVQAVILVSATLFLPLVLWMARRLEKKTTYIIATASWIVFMLAILLVPRGAKVPTYIIAFGVGLGVSSAHVLPRAMSPDVIEVDELMSGRRQEGIYSGINVFVRKLSTMLAVGAIGLALAWSGYVENAIQQTPQALTTIRILISVVPAVILLVSILVAYAYPLTRARHAEIQAELALRRGGEHSPLPTKEGQGKSGNRQ
jgi:GPH family glycoside/pentoside/hexuronide:cation symporter